MPGAAPDIGWSLSCRWRYQYTLRPPYMDRYTGRHRNIVRRCSHHQGRKHRARYNSDRLRGRLHLPDRDRPRSAVHCRIDSSSYTALYKSPPRTRASANSLSQRYSHPCFQRIHVGLSHCRFGCQDTRRQRCMHPQWQGPHNCPLSTQGMQGRYSPHWWYSRHLGFRPGIDFEDCRIRRRRRD